MRAVLDHPILGAQASASRRRANGVLVVGFLVLSVVAAFLAEPPTWWGLLPIAGFIVLTVSGVEFLLASVISLVGALIVLHPGPAELADIAGETALDQITMIGVIIMLAGGLGEVLRRVGVAEVLVGAVLRIFGDSNRMAVMTGIMASSLVLVAGLGTLAGALAVAAPIFIPVAARLGATRSATAAAMFIGGCAGLALAPFAGSNIVIMSSADVSYLQYLLYGAGPLAVMSVLLSFLVVPFIQRRTEGRPGEEYSAADSDRADDVRRNRSVPAALTFASLLVMSVAMSVIASDLGIYLPMIALAVMSLVVGTVGGLGSFPLLRAVFDGCRRQFSFFLIFLALAALFIVINDLEAFTVVLDTFGGDLQSMAPLAFAVVIALLGWVGVPGATAAQVVLLDKLFGPIAAALGIGSAAWVVVLLFASKADTYGPFPNGNMVGVMGLARSTNLKNMLITGWLVLLPVCVVYLLILLVET